MSDENKDVEAITELEQRRVDALLARDLDMLTAVTHPDLTYIHSTGATDTFESYLRKCRDGLFVYHHVDQRINKISMHGDLSLVLSDTEADVIAGGKPKHLSIVSMAVWARVGESWKLLAYQTTAKP